MPRQKLLTAKNLKDLPALYSQDGKSYDQIAVPVKFFDPYGSYTWYATEYDPEARLFFGLVTSAQCPEGEIGYFALDELQSLVKFGAPRIERDMYWNEKVTLGELDSRHGAHA